MRSIVIEYKTSTAMCILRNIQNFVRNGASVFSSAARGEYEHMSPRVKMLCEEIADSSDGPAIDKLRLRQDREKISQDVSTAFEKYISKSKK